MLLGKSIRIYNIILVDIGYIFFCFCQPQLSFPYTFFLMFLSYLYFFLYQAEAKILKGPHEDLESYLQAIQQLRNNIQFFNSNKSFKSSDGVLNHTNNLLAKAISKLEEEFKQLLSSYRLVLPLMSLNT